MAALFKESGVRTIRVVKVVSVLYLLVWMGAGLWAFVVGLQHPKELPALTNLGQSWLGLAVAAAYAYFGLRPET